MVSGVENSNQQAGIGMTIPSCPLGDRHGIDLLTSIHTQLGIMSTQLIHVQETSDEALVSIRQSDGYINELKFAVHDITAELNALKLTQKNFRAELDGYRKTVFASAIACLLGLLGLIGAAVKDHFGIVFK